MAFEKLRKSLAETAGQFNDAANQFHEMRNNRPHTASCGFFNIGDGTVSHMFQKWPILDCTLELVDNDTDSDRATVTRIAGGALVAGGTGAVVGGLARKSNAAGHMTLTTPDGVRQMKLRGKDVAKGKTFAMNFKLEQARVKGQVQA